MINHKHRLDLLYRNLPRELAIKLPHELIELEDLDYFDTFDSLFRSARGDMDKQFFEILSARQALFSCDVDNDWTCRIDPGLGVGHVAIQWPLKKIEGDGKVVKGGETSDAGETDDGMEISDDNEGSDDSGSCSVYGLHKGCKCVGKR